MRTLKAMIAAAGLVASASVTHSAEFVANEATNRDLQRRLNIPVYFAVPESARLALPKSVNTTDRLIDFRHPDAGSNGVKVGLRIVSTNRVGFSKRITQSGLIQTGDILLSFRPEWGGAGTYPNIQMGVSHAGMAYLAANGVIRHIDNPMDGETLGRGDFTSEHYTALKYLHVIRPRGLTDAHRANLAAWAQRMAGNVQRVYPKEIAFNKDYNAPKYSPGKPLEFVKAMGQSALGQGANGGKPLDLFCSEFAWSLLALRGCSPSDAGAFGVRGIPSCIKSPMTPMHATGNVILRRARTAQAGLADGPLLVIDAMKLPATERDSLLSQVFVENPGQRAKMSQGHREIAQEMQPKFEPLEKYYKDYVNGGFKLIEAYFIGRAFRNAMPDNYSPTSYLINTLLPPNNSHRTMDYVATVMFE